MIVGKLFFQLEETGGYRPVHHEIEYSRQEDGCSGELAGRGVLCNPEQFRHADGLRQGCILHQGNDLVCGGRDNALHYLGENDAEESLSFGKTQNLRGFVLTLGYGLDSSTVDLRKIGGIIYDKSDDDRSKSIVGKFKKIIGREVDEDKLKYERGSAHHKKVEIDRTGYESVFRHPAQGDRQSQR